MSWATLHQVSEEHAAQAEFYLKTGSLVQAREQYAHAAHAEGLAIQALDPNKQRTLGITTVSAASLWYKAGELERAQQMAHAGLAQNTLPGFAVAELQTLLQVIWAEDLRRRSQVAFTEGEVVVGVSGGDIVYGGAPLDLIMRKIDEVGRFVYRTIEMLLREPFRRRGMPRLEIQEQFHPWLFQVPAGSYQFAVRIRRPQQLSMFPGATPEVEKVTHTVLQIIKASVDDPGHELLNLVPETDYRNTFLKLTRNLAPTGQTFGQLTIETPGLPGLRPVILRPVAREIVNQAINDMRPSREQREETTQLRGTLRGVQLDKDWLELTLDETHNSVRVHGAGDTIDDVVGPMVNHGVVVDVVRRRGRYHLRDIQAKE